MVLLNITKISKNDRELIKVLRQKLTPFVGGVSREELWQDKRGPAADEN